MRPTDTTPKQPLVRRTGSLIVATGVLLTGLVACSGGGRAVSSGPVPRPIVQGHRLSKAEVLYGMGSAPNPAVRYQPDVVFIGGGPDAIAGEAANGVQWLLKGNAPGVK